MTAVGFGYLDTIGLVLSLTGAALLAANIRASAWGWVAFLLSNVAWLGYALIHGPATLALQHAAFFATSAIGVWRWRRAFHAHPPRSTKP